MFNKNYGEHYLFRDIKSVEELAGPNYKASSILLNDKVIGAYYGSYNPQQESSFMGGLAIDPKYQFQGLAGKEFIQENLPKLINGVKSYDPDIIEYGARAYIRPTNYVGDYADNPLVCFYPYIHRFKDVIEPGFYYMQVEKHLKKRKTIRVIPELEDFKTYLLNDYESRNKLDDLIITDEQVNLSELKPNRFEYDDVDEIVFLNTIGLEDKEIINLINKAFKHDILAVTTTSHFLNEQRVLYDNDFRPAGLMPYYYLIGDQRLDVIKLMSIKKHPDYNQMLETIKKVHEYFPPRPALAARVIEQFT